MVDVVLTAPSPVSHRCIIPPDRGKGKRRKQMLKEGESQARIAWEPLLKVRVHHTPQTSGNPISQLQKDGTCAACAQIHAHTRQKERAEEEPENSWQLSTSHLPPHQQTPALVKLSAPAQAKPEHYPPRKWPFQRLGWGTLTLKRKGALRKDRNLVRKYAGKGQYKRDSRVKIQTGKRQQDSELGLLGNVFKRHNHQVHLNTTTPICALTDSRQNENLCSLLGSGTW